MRPRVPVLLGAILLVLLLPATAAGQGAFVASVAPARVGFPEPGIAEFEAGSVRSDGVAVRVRARAPVAWVLTVRADAGDMGGYGKPVDDLQWRERGGDWRPLSTAEQVVATGSGSRRLTLDFRTLLSWERDGPGRYSTGVVFEVRPLGKGDGPGRAPVGAREAGRSLGRPGWR